MRSGLGSGVTSAPTQEWGFEVTGEATQLLIKRAALHFGKTGTKNLMGVHSLRLGGASALRSVHHNTDKLKQSGNLRRLLPEGVARTICRSRPNAGLAHAEVRFCSRKANWCCLQSLRRIREGAQFHLGTPTLQYATRKTGLQAYQVGH